MCVDMCHPTRNFLSINTVLTRVSRPSSSRRDVSHGDEVVGGKISSKRINVKSDEVADRENVAQRSVGRD